jgi:FkbM family methyltransferase
MSAMVVNTNYLFNRLLEKLGVDVICDVGSMDGSDALRFRGARPGAQIYAFECNPENVRLMRDDARLRAGDIRIVPSAVSDQDGEADFFLVPADYSYSRRNDARGMSSLYRRPSAMPPETVRVPTTRLDTFFRDKCTPETRLALWIDTEGKSFEVIQGTTGIAQQLRVLHIELESTNYVAPGQKLYPQVKAQLEKLGFSEVATDKSTSYPQFNAIFVRNSHSLPLLLWLKTYLFRDRLNFRLAAALARLRSAGANR